jgi:hypothetical protein
MRTFGLSYNYLLVSAAIVYDQGFGLYIFYLNCALGSSTMLPSTGAASLFEAITSL